MQELVFAGSPEEIEEESGEPEPLPDVGIFDLIRAFQGVLKRFVDDELGEIADDKFTVGDKIDYLLAEVGRGRRMKFQEMFSGAISKGEVVVTFLALLELIRLKEFRVSQQRTLGDIEIERCGEEGGEAEAGFGLMEPEQLSGFNGLTLRAVTLYTHFREMGG